MEKPSVIRLLPDSIANQIAAGEVVQRPASVVKELLENAVDAKARKIQLIVKDSGKALVQVIDDGTGMSMIDARMAFERHATSKIQSAEDLFKIKTLGFRGEALASIAAVAQVELRTRRTGDADIGTSIKVEGSDVKSQEPVATPEGTNILVKNLFFNVPARRNFLKSNPVEMRHIMEEFQRVALASPEVSFLLKHNDLEIFNLVAGKLVRRITDIFGKNYREQLAFCKEDTSLVSVRGYIGKPEFARKVRGEQFFFVNDRYVRQPYLHHAILNAFEGSLPEGSHPFYVLFIEIDASHIDINIHPTKTEVKFDDEKAVYAIIMAAVRKAISVYNLSGSINFEDDPKFMDYTPAPIRSNEISPNEHSHSTKDAGKLQGESFDHLMKLFEGFKIEGNEILSADSILGDGGQPEEFLPQSIKVASRANQMVISTGQMAYDTSLIFQLHNQYLVAHIHDSVILIDQRAAYERVLYERYREFLNKKNASSQQLLFPKILSISPNDMLLIDSVSEEIKSLGFDFDQLGPNEVIVRGIPEGLPDEDDNIFAELLEQLKFSFSDLKLNKFESLARALARRFSLQYLVRLTDLEMRILLDRLMGSSDPNRTPGGQPIIVTLSADRLESLFRIGSK